MDTLFKLPDLGSIDLIASSVNVRNPRVSTLNLRCRLIRRIFIVKETEAIDRSLFFLKYIFIQIEKVGLILNFAGRICGAVSLGVAEFLS